MEFQCTFSLSSSTLWSAVACKVKNPILKVGFVRGKYFKALGQFVTPASCFVIVLALDLIVAIQLLMMLLVFEGPIDAPTQ